MTSLRLFLIPTTLAIITMTILAVVNNGINWPAVYFGDFVTLDWRSQFNSDLLVYLLLFTLWIVWREGFSTKAFVLGFFSLFMGGVFDFPYLLYATYQAKGDASKMMLGVHYETP